MENRLLELMDKYKKGNRSTFNLGSFLIIEKIQEHGLSFNEILQKPESMEKAALMNVEMGFESTALPFDLNVEAEIMGARVKYHEEMDGIPIYPTIEDKPVQTARDITIPGDMEKRGRMPVILECLQNVKKKAASQAAVSTFIPGPFTLAGQVMDINEVFLMSMKKPEQAQEILNRLSDFILRLIRLYAENGADIVVIEEGGATSVSPKVFKKLIHPCLKALFADKKLPMALSLTGQADRYMDLMLECEADGIGVDQESDLEKCVSAIPDNYPLFSVCGEYKMLAEATPEQVEKKVNETLDKGLTTVFPPADIYPPAKIENIKAFVRAVRNYNG